jgi:hypothetical protein
VSGGWPAEKTAASSVAVDRRRVILARKWPVSRRFAADFVDSVRRRVVHRSVDHRRHAHRASVGELVLPRARCAVEPH